jgi:hypothetical protein
MAGFLGLHTMNGPALMLARPSMLVRATISGVRAVPIGEDF